MIHQAAFREALGNSLFAPKHQIGKITIQQVFLCLHFLVAFFVFFVRWFFSVFGLLIGALLLDILCFLCHYIYLHYRLLPNFFTTYIQFMLFINSLIRQQKSQYFSKQLHYSSINSTYQLEDFVSRHYGSKNAVVVGTGVDADLLEHFARKLFLNASKDEPPSQLPSNYFSGRSIIHFFLLLISWFLMVSNAFFSFIVPCTSCVSVNAKNSSICLLSHWNSIYLFFITPKLHPLFNCTKLSVQPQHAQVKCVKTLVHL